MRDTVGYIDTSDKLSRMQLTRQMIWNLVDSIEDAKGLMAHEISDLAPRLQAYQDEKIGALAFYNFLTKYYDEMRS